MSTLLPPNLFLSADLPLSADTAAAVYAASPETAAAGPIPDPTSNEGRHQGAPADDPNPFDAGATDCISEIFIGARKWIDDDHRFVIDEQAFLEAIEPPPLFMQRAM